MTGQGIRILVADDHKMFCEALRVLIDQKDHMEVVAEAHDGRAAVRASRKLKPDIVILDIEMPLLNGVEAARQILADCPGVKIIALSVHSDRRIIARMLEAGASGFVLKDCAFEELLGAIRSVMAGRSYLSPRVADTVLDDYVKHLAGEAALREPMLTRREREVLQLIAEGKGTRKIAELLSVSMKTVETHRKKIMDKLGLHSVAELTKYAIREGLTSL